MVKSNKKHERDPDFKPKGSTKQIFRNEHQELIRLNSEHKETKKSASLENKNGDEKKLQLILTNLNNAPHELILFQKDSKNSTNNSNGIENGKNHKNDEGVQIKREIFYFDFLYKKTLEIIYKQKAIKIDNEHGAIKEDISNSKKQAEEHFDKNLLDKNDSVVLSEIKKAFYAISEVEKFLQQYDVRNKKNINDFKDNEYFECKDQNDKCVSKDMNDILNAENILEQYIYVNFNVEKKDMKQFKINCINEIKQINHSRY